MLGMFRRKAQSPVIQVTILVVILVFIFWGASRNRGSKVQNAVATVNGESITFRDYQKEYDKTMSNLRDQLGGSIPSGLLDSLNIKQQVLDKLVNSALLRQGAAQIGLYVSDQELRNAIQDMEAFKENGVFNGKRYEQVLAASRMTVPQFEEGMRYDLLTSKVFDHLSRFASVSPAAVKDIFGYQYRQIKLRYLAVKAEAYAGKVDKSADKLAAYFDKNKSKYQTDPQVKLRYLLFPLAEFAGAPPSDEEVAKYYKTNIDKFTTPERRQASHILIRSSEKDSPEKRAAARKKIEEIAAQLKAGGDFATLAKQDSQDGSAQQGGELGFFSRGQMVKPFEDAVFSMKEGQISEVVETPFGFHLIKLEKIEPAKVESLEEAKKAIIAQMTSEEAKNKAFKAANDTYEQIIAAGSLEKYSQGGAQAAIHATELFTQKNPPKELQSLPELTNVAFTLKKGELSSIIETSKGYAILMVDDTVPPAQQELAAVRDRVEADYVAAESVKLAKAAAEEALAKVKAGEALEQEAKALGVEVQTTPFFSRAQTSDAKLPLAVAQQTLSLSEKSPVLDTVAADHNTFYVLVFKEAKDPDPAAFAAKQGELETKLAGERKEDLVTAWLEYLRKAATITTNPQLLR